MIKKCPSCGEEKPYNLFYQNKYSKTNTSPYCKACSSARTISYARDNRSKIPTTGYALKRRYGITSEDYKNILESQNFKCAICGIDQCKTKRNFAVDHNHDTKKIRGLLCSNCNVGLGNYQDSIELLKKAIIYLEEKDV